MSKLALLGGKKTREAPFPSSPVFGKEEKSRIKKVLDSGLASGFIANSSDAFYGGPNVRELEDAFKKYFDTDYAIAVNSATAGLHCAIGSLDIGPGDEVIVPPYTMSASATAILMSNAIPVFVDIEEDVFCINPKVIEESITERTKAIIVVHLFGQAAKMDEIMSIAKKHDLKVIEDCAQAPAATYKERFVGTIGDIGVFSFNQHKTITTGEGGVIITNNENIAKKCALIRNHGEVVVSNMDVDDIVNVVGWNYRMTELEAAVGIAQFEKLDSLTEHRIELAEYLTNRLQKLSIDALTLPKILSMNKHVYFVYPIKYDETKTGISRTVLVKALTAEGIPFGAGYVRPIYLEPMYQRQIGYGKQGCPFKCPFYEGKLNYSEGICPTTERLFNKDLILTGICHYPLTKNDIDDAVSAISKVFKSLDDLEDYQASD